MKRMGYNSRNICSHAPRASTKFEAVRKTVPFFSEEASPQRATRWRRRLRPSRPLRPCPFRVVTRPSHAAGCSTPGSRRRPVTAWTPAETRRVVTRSLGPPNDISRDAVVFATRPRLVPVPHEPSLTHTYISHPRHTGVLRGSVGRRRALSPSQRALADETNRCHARGRPELGEQTGPRPVPAHAQPRGVRARRENVRTRRRRHVRTRRPRGAARRSVQGASVPHRAQVAHGRIAESQQRFRKPIRHAVKDLCFIREPLRRAPRAARRRRQAPARVPRQRREAQARRRHTVTARRDRHRTQAPRRRRDFQSRQIRRRRE